MGRLTAALTDRARVVSAIGAAPRVEGATPMATIRGDWWACRLVPADAGEREDPVGGRRYVTQRAELIVGPDVQVRASDRVQVESPLLGDGTWRVVGEPRAAASRRQVRARVVPLERITEPAREALFS